jgi:hypothetical protein
MYVAERERLLLEYLTPAEIADFDVPIDYDDLEKLGAPKRIAYRRFAESKGVDPDNTPAIEEAFSAEVWRRFLEKERKWLRGEGDYVA